MYKSVRPGPVMVVLALLACATANGEQALVDPTRPAGWNRQVTVDEPIANGESAAMVLQAIFSTGGRRSAVISGTRVSVGDHVAGGEVIEIGRNHVNVRTDQAVVELRVGIARVKTLAGQPHAAAPSLLERAGGPMR